MLTPSPNVEQQRDELYEILAYRIPALSPAMGGQSGDVIKALNPISLRVDSGNWPRKSGAYANKWLHSDIKNQAFKYVFDSIIVLSSFLSTQ